MKQLEKSEQKIPQWSYEEDLLLAQLVKSVTGEIEWQSIAKEINNKFHQKKSFRKSQQTRRRWEKVVSVALKKPWSRKEAQKFVNLSQQYVHTSRRFWNRLKKEFKTYTYKMLKHKLKQLKQMSAAQFILEHQCEVYQRVATINDPLAHLCKYLSETREDICCVSQRQ